MNIIAEARRIIKVIFLRSIVNRWEAERNARIEREAQKVAEDIVMRVIDATKPAQQDAEQLKLKVKRILLRQETPDYNYHAPEPDNCNCNSRQSTNRTGEIEPNDEDVGRVQMPAVWHDKAEIYYQRGNHYHEEGRYDEAIVDFKKVLELVRSGKIEKSCWLAGGIFRVLANSHSKRDNPGDKKIALDYLDEGINFLSE